MSDNKTALNLVKEYSNNELRSLLKELKQINMSEVPAKFKCSDKMKALYDAEKQPYYDWLDCHFGVSDAIRFEILKRVERDIF